MLKRQRFRKIRMDGELFQRQISTARNKQIAHGYTQDGLGFTFKKYRYKHISVFAHVYVVIDVWMDI